MAKTEDLIAFLAQVPLFQGLKNRHLKQIADRFAPRTFQPDQAIVTQGQIGFGMFMVTSGQAEAVLEHPDGTKTVVNTFGPTDFFGEVALIPPRGKVGPDPIGPRIHTRELCSGMPLCATGCTGLHLH